MNIEYAYLKYEKSSSQAIFAWLPTLFSSSSKPEKSTELHYSPLLGSFLHPQVFFFSLTTPTTEYSFYLPFLFLSTTTIQNVSSKN